jgi:L-alanine-DL-glutamate epimerase-like enolase superfamily enzyme
MAHEAGVALTPHSCNTAIGFVVACHLQRALPNAEVQEFETFDNPFIHSIFNEPFALTDGKLVLSEAPGLGVTLNEETAGRWRAD